MFFFKKKAFFIILFSSFLAFMTLIFCNKCFAKTQAVFTQIPEGFELGHLSFLCKELTKKIQDNAEYNRLLQINKKKADKFYLANQKKLDKISSKCVARVKKQLEELECYIYEDEYSKVNPPKCTNLEEKPMVCGIFRTLYCSEAGFIDFSDIKKLKYNPPNGTQKYCEKEYPGKDMEFISFSDNPDSAFLGLCRAKNRPIPNTLKPEPIKKQKPISTPSADN